MSDRVRHLNWTGLLLAGLAIVDAAPAPAPDALWVFGADGLAAQTVRQEEVARFLEARRAINAEEFERAVALFQAVRTESPIVTPRFEPDSYYWEAFARYRLGDLAEARALLEVLMVGFDETRPADPRRHTEAGRLYHDARALEFEIRSQLASRGDAGDAERLLREAEETLDVAAPMPGFRVMPVEVEGRTLSVPVSTADLTALPDSVAADLLAEAQGGDVQAVQDWAQRLAEYTDPVADYEEQVAAYAREISRFDWQRAEFQEALRAGSFDWQRAEFQEALRAGSQEQEACEDVSVQLAALEAVMRFDDVNRVQVLRDVLTREDECSMRLHDEAVELIAREETEESERVILGIIANHPEPSVRRSALQELWRFNSRAAFRVLAATLRDSDDDAEQSDAISGLRSSRYAVDTSAPTAIQNALVAAAANRSKSDRIRYQAIVALGDLDHVEGGVLVRLYDRLDSDGRKETLLRALARKVRDKEDMQTAEWARLLAYDTEVSSDVRGAAFSAWAAHPTLTVAYLADLYGELPEAFLKRQAIYAIYQRAGSDPTAPRVLMELIRNEPDQEVRERGIYWLGRTESEEAVDFLLELLRPPSVDSVVVDSLPPSAIDTLPKRPG
ncbi:tetratricopeptide repeat protein [Candidatus Palauibacter sp.]|uniref:tetratricopeptide repeat protein n=1 Tax=Candidatus Palauibacter sp. TaxID=3101350 RepID=UPI003B0243E5